MKAKPVKLIIGRGYEECLAIDCTHVKLKIPGPTQDLYLPVILSGKRDGTGCWSWNGDIEKPTLKPSVLTEGSALTDDGQFYKFRCHTWINDGQAIFLDDCRHEYKGQTLDLIDL